MNDFDLKIWLTKGLKKAILTACIGGLAEFAAYIEIEPVPVKYVWITVLGIEGIEWLINYIKHKYLKA